MFVTDLFVLVKTMGTVSKSCETLLTYAFGEECCDSVSAKELQGHLCGPSVFCGILT